MAGQSSAATAAGSNAAASAQQSGTVPKPQNVEAAEQEAANENCPECCKTKKICFEPRSKKIRNNPKRMKEFRRQLAAQERGINGMSPSRLMANRRAFLDPVKRAAAEAQSAASNAANRKLYRTAYRKYLMTVTPKTPGRNPYLAIARATYIIRKLNRHMKTVAVLHNPDKIAGGEALQPINPLSLAKARFGQKIPEIGDRVVNSSIGKLWGSRAKVLEKHVRQQEKHGCKSPQVKLRVCKSKPGQPGEPAK